MNVTENFQFLFLDEEKKDAIDPLVPSISIRPRTGVRPEILKDISSDNFY